ncbi:MAG TPA: outer membrane protein assembly factor BamD [Pirellulales bacterium]
MSLLIPAKFFFLLAILCAAVGMIGCKGTPIDVAKGRPSDNDIPDDVKSDYDAKEPSGWERLSPENLGKTMKKAVGMGPNQKIGEGLFDEAEKLFAAKEYDKAASKFAAAADRWPNSTLEEDSMFLKAESYFFADKYSSANDQYGELLKKYPNTRHLDATTARQFVIARYWQQADESHHRWTLVPNIADRTQPLFDTPGHASNAFDSVRINDPRGPLADSAAMAAGTMAFKRHRYEDADYYYNIVRTDYPKSKFQLQSHLLGVQCKLLKYQGPGYNSKPLEEANQLIDQTLAQFTHELGDERERLVKAKAEVRAQMATRDIQLAQYWDKGDHYGAARIYYAQVLKDYPQTPFADEAKTRLAVLEGKPNEPPSRLAFLTDWAKPKNSDSNEPGKGAGSSPGADQKTTLAQQTPPPGNTGSDNQNQQAQAAGQGPLR